MNTPVAEFYPGSLVSARGREWIVLPESTTDTLRLRPLGGGEKDESLIYLPLELQPVGRLAESIAVLCGHEFSLRTGVVSPR